jgi:hypothetical protein
LNPLQSTSGHISTKDVVNACKAGMIASASILLVRTGDCSVVSQTLSQTSTAGLTNRFTTNSSVSAKEAVLVL